MARRSTPVIDALLKDRPIINALRETVRNTLDRQDVPILVKDVPAATDKVVADIQASPDVAVVATKSTWLSKINWTHMLGIALSGIEVAFTSLPPETLLLLVGGNQIVAGIATFILKTWFTKTVTPQSASKPA